MTMKRKYLELYVKPELADLGIAIPAHFNGDADRFMEYLANLPWSGYSGRGVEEKLGHSRAHSYDALLQGIEQGLGLEQGILFVILGNEQPNDESHNLVRKMREDTARLNSQNLPGNSGKIVFKNSFALDEQITAFDGT